MGNHFWLSCGLTKATLKRYATTFQIPLYDALGSLARTISSDRCWDTPAGSVIIYRNTADNAGQLAVCTNTQASQASSIQTQLNYLNQSTQQVRYLDHESCIKYAKALAVLIKNKVNPIVLKNAQIESIPRGGLFVTGLLSYLLPLAHHQFDHTKQPDQPVILIDDCSISGYRLYQQLKRFQDREVMFFTLASPNALREAALACESRLRVFESVIDLPIYKHLPCHFSDRYWLGQADAICFPWGESQRFYQTQDNNELNHLWSISPLSSSFKSSLRAESIDVHAINESEKCLISTKAHILYYSSDGFTRIYNCNTHEQFSLENTASEIWQSLLSFNTMSEVITHLTSRFNVDLDNLKNDVESFIAKLKQIEVIQ